MYSFKKEEILDHIPHLFSLPSTVIKVALSRLLLVFSPIFIIPRLLSLPFLPLI